MLSTANMLTMILALISVAMTVILFLVGRLLSANKDAVDELRVSLRDQAQNSQEAFRSLFGAIDKLRSQLGAVDVRVARMEGQQSATVEHLKEVKTLGG